MMPLSLVVSLKKSRKGTTVEFVQMIEEGIIWTGDQIES